MGARMTFTDVRAGETFTLPGAITVRAWPLAATSAGAVRLQLHRIVEAADGLGVQRQLLHGLLHGFAPEACV